MISAHLEWAVKLGRLYVRLSQPIAFLARKFIARTASEHGSALPGRNCIDIGAGVAPYRNDLIIHFGLTNYTAIDIAPGDTTDLVADATALPLNSNSIDLVVSFDVLQHIFNYAKALDEIGRVLKTGGCCMISVPFMYSECDYHDYHRWSIEGFESELAARGFDVITIIPRGGVFFTLGCFAVWAVQHCIPGQRRNWRSRRDLRAVVRGILMMIFTLPFTILAWLGLAVDHILPRSGMYMGLLVYARKTGAHRC